MASASGIKAGAAYVELLVKDSALVKGLQAAAQKLQAFGALVTGLGVKMAGLGVGIVTPLLASAKSFAEMGDQLDKMSIRTGISVETLSELGYAAKLSGASLEDVGTGVRNMQRTIAEAAQGSKTAADALARLGLSADELMRLSPEQQFDVIAARLNAIKDPALKAATAMEVFGKAGTTLIPMMEDLPKLRAEARKLGAVMSTEDAKAAAELNDAMDRFAAVFRSLIVVVGGTLAPILTDMAGKVTGLVASFREWLSQNTGLIVSILKIGGVLVAVGAGLVALGGVISAIGTAFGALASVIVGAVSFVLSPVGLLIAGIVGIASTMLWATDSSDQALSWLGGKFQELKDSAMEAFSGIKDALAAGDIALAGKILWLALKLEWQKGVAFLTEAWIAFKETFMTVAANAVSGTARIMANSWAGLQYLWLETTTFFADAWTNFTSNLIIGWKAAVAYVEKGINLIKELWDDSFDAETANKAVDKKLRKEAGKIQAERNAALEGRKTEHDQRLREIETERAGTVAGIEADAKREAAKRKGSYDAEARSAQDELEKAREEYRKALAEAKGKRVARETGSQPDTGKPPEIDPNSGLVERLKAGLGDVGTMVSETVKKTVEVTGTFNAAVISGLGASGLDERTAKASEETAKNTKRLVNEAQAGGVVFA